METYETAGSMYSQQGRDGSPASEAKENGEDQTVQETSVPPGVAEVMSVYAEYRHLLDLSAEYLAQFEPRFSLTTSDSSI